MMQNHQTDRKIADFKFAIKDWHQVQPNPQYKFHCNLSKHK